MIGAFPTLTGDGARRLAGGSWRVAVVGAGGWMGLAALEELRQLLGPEAFAARVVAFGSSHRRLALRGGHSVEQSPLSALSDLAPMPTLVLHLAFLTQEKAGTMSEDAYRAANRRISETVLAALDPIGAAGLFYASSGAVELIGGAHRNKAIYGELKLEDEGLFSAWGERAGRPVAIARIFGLSGAYINKLSSYALACFIADVLEDRPIQIASSHPVYRSYVAVEELFSVAFGLITDPSSGVTLFDTGADRGYEMGEIALAVERALRGGEPIRRPPLDPSSEDRYVGDGRTYAALRERLRVSRVDFPEQVRRTRDFMASAALA